MKIAQLKLKVSRVSLRRMRGVCNLYTWLPQSYPWSWLPEYRPQLATSAHGWVVGWMDE